MRLSGGMRQYAVYEGNALVELRDGSLRKAA
jgi:hypothetical protein